MRRWAGERSIGEWVGLTTGVAVFGYLAWDRALWDARLQAVLHLIAAVAIGWLVARIARRGEMPRTRVDLPIVGLVAAFALATLLAVNPGMSLRSLAAIVATALMLPLALVALRARPAWVATVVCVPILVLAAVSLGWMLGRRAAWVLVGAPGLPPLRLLDEGTPFGSVAVAPFILLAAWVIAGVIAERTWRRAVRSSIVGIGIPLAILSGSRSAWIAIGITIGILLLPRLSRSRGRILAMAHLSGRRRLARVLAIVVGLPVAVLLVAPRLTAVSSLLYREALWRDTISAWSASPVTGLGPGIMPWAREAAAADLSFPVSQPHSHNLALGVLGDAGIIGLVAAAVLIVAFALFAGPWRARTPLGRAASAALIGIGVAGMFEDLTFLPGFNLVTVLLVAIALADADAVRWVTPPRPPALAVPAVAAVAVVLGGAAVVSDAGAVAYRAGIDASERGDWPAARDAFEASTRIDPWHPAGPDALGIALVSTGDLAAARTSIERAVELAPGNGRAWANLAAVCGRLNDRTCGLDAAREAVDFARQADPTLANAALVLDALGRNEEADDVFRRSLLTNPLTSFAVDWPRRVTIGSGRIEALGTPVSQLSILIAKMAMGETIWPYAYSNVAVRALALAFLGRDDEARAAIAFAQRAAPESPVTWELDLVLRRARGEPLDRPATILRVLRGEPVPDPAAPVDQVPGPLVDIGALCVFPRGGLVEGANALLPQPPYPWALGAFLLASD